MLTYKQPLLSEANHCPFFKNIHEVMPHEISRQFQEASYVTVMLVETSDTRTFSQP
jgi:hypothetical protein